MTHRLIMSIEQNILVRETVNELVEFGIEFARDNGVDAAHVRQFWCRFREVAGDLIDEQDPIWPSPADVAATKPREFRAFDDDDPFPFGRPRDDGLTMCEVPEDYEDWFMRQDWRDKWPAVVEYFESAE